ncbi:related to APL5 - AP-3 complex subunit, gamma-adaptin, 107 KD [Cephalotrichum gorgonifer]|uniref:AP-3 complex subunit delta n=1 Tax=Cephalotrichum gorgonifer TaxID=2041049 RepID=A0AAE8SU99_9PEZI|nr:related to APL5 - AP-3 complex subunit, gamma-adaptin, 107 KD [Cephalotrichum gorgonifer]
MPSSARILGVQKLCGPDGKLLREPHKEAALPEFEKSLYDLIRGLRNHKGNEREYIQNCLKECRAEIRSSDMDLKATALLKLIYLEMVGHDMSWASFHVLEVMSSAKYHQKRVGYLGAAQSFRPDTEVLMLATNLLKKDLSATAIPVMSLPITTLPHIITPSLALSVQSEMLTRLGHSHANVRKKTVVTLYRLALVYPETLRAAWPKIKERLMDKEEDPSVTAAIINVICELGWRRPHDFLPLAPRLFELLVDGGNNWMAIKLIKLFATLTPLEPRLIRKLLPPLTEIIRTTPAMSLLYECINGIIQGGILGGAEEISGREEIASLCVDKLRSMILVDGDPNLKYVALLAFNKIVVTHPFLVSQQEDVILECIDSPDITIRIKALDLVQGMVSPDNLLSVVSRLMKQLRASQPPRTDQDSGNEWVGDSDEDANTDSPRPRPSTHEPLLPEEYQIDIIGRILRMCSQNNYSSITDFDWYLDVLTQLVRLAPSSRTLEQQQEDPGFSTSRSTAGDVAETIGNELRSVAVKVRAMRGATVRAADLILQQLLLETPLEQRISSMALKSIIWVLGEYATSLADPDTTIGLILQLIPRTSTPAILTTSLQATMKIFALIAGDAYQPWSPERKSRISLLIARIIDSFEPSTQHPSLEVQERAVEFVELLRLTSEAVAGHAPSSDDLQQDPPLLLTQAIPSLFAGWELNSVAVGAQANVPVPDGLDLDNPIHPNLEGLLAEAEMPFLKAEGPDEFDSYYNQKAAATSLSSETALPAIARLSEAPDEYTSSYQQASEDSYLDADILARRKADRMERNRDDPFYIGSDVSKSSTPIHRIIQSSNGPDLDIDSIPIMQLDIDKLAADAPHPAPKRDVRPAPRRTQIVVAADETLSGSGHSTPRYDSEDSKGRRRKQQLLQMPTSSALGALSLEGAPPEDVRARDDEEMAKAMKEVERLRLEMQRANERIGVAKGVDAGGTVVKKKAKKKKAAAAAEGEGGVVVAKKKKKKKPVEIQE